MLIFYVILSNFIDNILPSDNDDDDHGLDKTDHNDEDGDDIDEETIELTDVTTSDYLKPIITVTRTEYQLGDEVQLNCSLTIPPSLFTSHSTISTLGSTSFTPTKDKIDLHWKLPVTWDQRVRIIYLLSSSDGECERQTKR